MMKSSDQFSHLRLTKLIESVQLTVLTITFLEKVTTIFYNHIFIIYKTKQTTRSIYRIYNNDTTTINTTTYANR